MPVGRSRPLVGKGREGHRPEGARSDGTQPSSEKTRRHSLPRCKVEPSGRTNRCQLVQLFAVTASRWRVFMFTLSREAFTRAETARDESPREDRRRWPVMRKTPKRRAGIGRLRSVRASPLASTGVYLVRGDILETEKMHASRAGQTNCARTGAEPPTVVALPRRGSPEELPPPQRTASWRWWSVRQRALCRQSCELGITRRHTCRRKLRRRRSFHSGGRGQARSGRAR